MGFTGKNELLSRLTSALESMPAFSDNVHKIIAMTADINCAPKDLLKVIESDPVMTMKLLKLVNSPFFALSRNITSIKFALVYLGLNTVKNLALSVAVVDVLPRQSVPGLSMPSFLTHSIATALISQQLARKFLHTKDASDYFVAGLLHDFGKAVLIQFEPDSYAKILRQAKDRQCSLAQVEVEVWGVSNAEVGAMLAESWQLPAPLVDSIRTCANYDEKSSDLAIVVAAANIVAKHMKLGDGGNPCAGEFSDIICRRLDSDFETILLQMDGLEDEIESMKKMVQQ